MAIAALRRPKLEPPTPDPSCERAVLLVSEGREFSDDAVELAVRLASEQGRAVRVVAIARMWGSALGLPHPGLRPNEHELAGHQENVTRAIRSVKRAGVAADGHIITSRKPTKSILHEADRLGSEAIVMGADRRRNRFVADLMWTQEPYRVHRRAPVPVHLVVDTG